MAFDRSDGCAKDSEPCIAHSLAYHFKRGEFFGDEKHGLAACEGGGNKISDGLRFASCGRSFDHKILPAQRVNQCDMS